LALALLLPFGFVLTGCRQDMANQPKHRALSPAAFFDDGRSERPLVEGTVARGSLEQDALALPKDSNAYPLPLTQALLERGAERYNIFCSVCHGSGGDGNGMVVQRGFRRPPSYHIDRLRQAPHGYFYDVITHGFGAMSDYAAQIPPGDRWAIIAYVRALQLSQHARPSDLPAQVRENLGPRGAAK
jgi:mono/diheme cytochrome c family protein